MTRCRTHHSKTQVGTAEAINSNKLVGKAWASLPQTERQQFAVAASRMQAARTQLKARSFGNAKASEEADECNLRESQVHRINHSRLDGTLSLVAEHGAWDQGLALSDHISALRANFLDVVTQEEASGWFAQYFGYDSEVFKNGTLPIFSILHVDAFNMQT